MLWLPSKRNLANADTSLSCRPASSPKGAALHPHVTPKQEAWGDSRTAHRLLSPSAPLMCHETPPLFLPLLSQSSSFDSRGWCICPTWSKATSPCSYLRNVFDHDGAVWLSNIYLFPWWPLRNKSTLLWFPRKHFISQVAKLEDKVSPGWDINP